MLLGCSHWRKFSNGMAKALCLYIPNINSDKQFL